MLSQDANELQHIAAALPLEEKIGQLLMASLDGLTVDAEAEQFLLENHIGNLVHFGNNAQTPAQTAALNESLQRAIEARCGVPPLIGIDHEGGRVMRFQKGVTWFPSAMAIGATGDAALAEAIGRAMGEELRALGFHINFAPALDCNTNPQNPVIGVRSFGDDPKRVAALGTAMARGMEAVGLMACAKHFPGHGDTAVDSHFGLPLVPKPLEQLEQVELYPFAEAIRQGISAIMTSHILFPAIEPDVPATMSGKVLQHLLRGQLGFDGLIVSDAMHMQAIQAQFGLERGCVEAVKNGVDLICIGTGGAGFYASQARCYRALLAAAKSGELPMPRIEDAVRRVMAAKAKHCPPFVGTIDWAAHETLARRTSEASIVWLRQDEKGPMQGKVLCASAPIAEVRFGVGEGDWRTRTFMEMATEALGCEGVLLPEEDTLLMPTDFDVLVVGISGRRTDAAALRWLGEAVRHGKRTIAVLTQLPYDIDCVPPGCAAVCLFGMTEPSVRAACRVLRGEIEARGTSPVKLT